MEKPLGGFRISMGGSHVDYTEEGDSYFASVLKAQPEALVDDAPLGQLSPTDHHVKNWKKQVAQKVVLEVKMERVSDKQFVLVVTQSGPK
jgi:hypothetical protein